MRKYIVVSVALTFLLGSISSISTSSAAVPKLGAKCTKVGGFFDTQGARFVCTKEGAKKVWRTWNPTNQKDNGSTPVRPATIPKVPYVAKIPISLPVKQTGSITFANAAAQFESIPEVAWKQVQDAIEANSKVSIPTTIYIGPNTGTTKEQMIPLLEKNYQLFEGFLQPTSYFGLVYNGEDEPWAEKKLAEILKEKKLSQLEKHFTNVMRGSCDLSNKSDPSCTGGNSLNFYPTTAGASLYGVQEPYWTATKQNVGPMSQVNHEYTHNVQFAQWHGAALGAGKQSGTEEAHTKMPCWFQEGQANAIGIPVWAPDLKSYVDARKGNVARGLNSNLPKPSLKNYSAASFAKFLYEQDPLTCYSPSSGDYQLGYSVGYAAVEALIAIGGPEATMALLTTMAAGGDWAAAFKKVYGITWKEGSTALGEVLAAEYAQLPLGSG